MSEVASADHTKIGILNGVMPSVRIRMAVTIRFRPPRMDDQPTSHTPMKNIWMPIGARAERGG